MRASLLCCCLFWLAGCAVTPATVDMGWEAHRQQVSALDHWTARGKLAVRSGEEAGTASLDWLQMGHHSHLEISGPLGLQATRIHSDGEHLYISRGEEEARVDLSSPGAVRAYTGWDIPVNALSWWLRGLPSPHSPARQSIDQGLLRTLHQDGWSIRFDSYVESGELRLPQRLELERGDTSARLLIRDWQTDMP